MTAGVISLWKGITPAALRGLTYGGLRFGLYSPFKAALGVQEGDKGSLHKKVAAGCLSGGLSAAISNPTELVRCLFPSSSMHLYPPCIISAAVQSS